MLYMRHNPRLLPSACVAVSLCCHQPEESNTRIPLLLCTLAMQHSGQAFRIWLLRADLGTQHNRILLLECLINSNLSWCVQDMYQGQAGLHHFTGVHNDVLPEAGIRKQLCRASRSAHPAHHLHAF